MPSSSPEASSPPPEIKQNPNYGKTKYMFTIPAPKKKKRKEKRGTSWLVTRD